ncbi:MAG: polyprenyl synthetase family protein [Halobacteriales archaeon]
MDDVPRVVKENARLVNEALDDRLPLGELRVHEAAEHLLTAGGKRLRPALLMLVADAFGRSPRDTVPPALAVEITHSFTLIHDDVMDDDPLRRGEESVHERWDVPTAILTGDYLYSKAFETALETETDDGTMRRVMETLAETCTLICEGQALDVEYAEAETVDEDDYLRMVELKTGVLFAASTGIGALVAGADAFEETYGYGLRIGKAFQIYDDVLDLVVESDDLGKTRASDLFEGKNTLVTLHARRNGVDPTLPGDATDAEVEEKVDEIRDAGSIEYARERAETLVDEAKQDLDALPQGDERDALADVADYLVRREY